jgi:hypothetical protein
MPKKAEQARDYAKMIARRDVIKRHKPEFLENLPTGTKRPAWFERLLQGCEKDAHEIACEAGEEASNQTRRTELSVAAYEAAYLEAYADALPALMGAALAKYDALDSAA